jgi:methylated-DNA-protein-cysteine methyltransferase-like protein
MNISIGTTTSKSENLFNRIYMKVREIPEGKVCTYGEVAKALGIKDVRKIGWALHANRDLATPCHRVVNKEGKLAANFAFDGEQEQRRRLEAEGVEFMEDGKVDLTRQLYFFDKVIN